MRQAQVQFDCPYCGVSITINAEDLAPQKQILCVNGCKKLIPAGVFYEDSNGTNGESV